MQAYSCDTDTRSQRDGRFRELWTMTAVAIAIASLVPLACSRDVDRSQQRPPVRVRLKWLHQAQFAGFYAAQHEGYYRDAGVEVVLNPGGIDYPSIPLVENGADDLGVTGADQILKARADGKPIVAVAVIYRRTPFCLFTWKKSHLIRMADLVGRPVGVKLGGNEEFTYRAMLASALANGEVAAKDVTMEQRAPKLRTEVPVKYDLNPFLDSEVVAWPGYSINEPLLAKEKTGQDVTLITPEQYGIQIYADVLFTTESYLHEHPDVVRAVARATVKGWHFALEPANRAKTVDYVLRFAMWSNPAHEDAMLMASVPLVAPRDAAALGRMTPQEWTALPDIMLRYGFLDRQQDVGRCFSNASLD